jgi:MOSC domain-containing protein YiiM
MSVAPGPCVLSVNVARVRPNPYKDAATTGIDKQSVAGPVVVRAPGSKRGGHGSGLVGDHIGDRENHGGDDQAVYAYASEDLMHWAHVLRRELAPGSFGENLTTQGLDVNAALIAERWIIGGGVELEVTDPRIPCSTFRGWIDERGWLKTFTAAVLPGAYLRVITPGTISAGDAIEVSHRPDHQITVAAVFRAFGGRTELEA